MDKQLRNQKLEDLHTWLTQNYPDYLALCEAGSTTAGDPWVEGRSDRDITVVVKVLTDEIQADIREYLKGRFGDTYLFIIFDEATFLATHSEQDLSHKFRGETLFGEDVNSKKETPPREFAEAVADRGLKTTELQLRTRLMNAEHWSVEQLRNYLYRDLKKLIMFLAARKYADTGVYPASRLDVASAYESGAIKDVVTAIQTIDSIETDELITITKSALMIAENNL